MILLTKEEINFRLDELKENATYGNGLRAIAKAQLKKVANWLDTYCESGRPRRECGHCWQSLLKEIEG